MDITPANIRAVGTSLRSEFKNGLGGIESQWNKIASLVTSTKSRETYAWLGDIPRMREWIGERRKKTIGEKTYQLINRDFEDTIVIPRNKFDDDELGTFSTVARGLGIAAGNNPDILVFQALVEGFDRECYDGQNFFDTEHPVGDADDPKLVSNMQAGVGEPWFLLDTTQAIMPLIYQRRQAPNLVGLTSPDDPNLFHNKEYIWGVDTREAAGYGYWQTAFASKAPLNAENYQKAREAMGSITDDEGEPLGIKPTLLVVGVKNEAAALRLLNNQLKAGGETNEWFGTAELLKSSRIV